VSKNLRLVTDRIAAKNRLDELDQTLSNINSASAEIKQAAYHANGTIETLQDRAGATFRNFNNTLDKMNMTLANAQVMINSANSLIDRNTFHIDHALLNIDRLSQHLDETIETIQADPSVMVWGSRVSDRETEK